MLLLAFELGVRLFGHVFGESLVGVDSHHLIRTAMADIFRGSAVLCTEQIDQNCANGDGQGASGE